MKKEILCYVSTEEEGEFVQVRRVMGNPKYFLLARGNEKLVVNLEELVEAIGTIQQLSNMFDIEEQRKRKGPVQKVEQPSSNSNELEFTFDPTRETTESEKELAQMVKDVFNEGG